jgi:hypothetical protein
LKWQKERGKLPPRLTYATELQRNPVADEPKLPTGYRQGLITSITVVLTASLLFFRFLAIEPASGPWTRSGAISASVAAISICMQFYVLWRALQPRDEEIAVYRVTLRWFAAAILFLMGSFMADIVASVIY